MQHRTLRRTGIKVSPYCLGAMMFGPMGNPDHHDCAHIVHKALDNGIDFIDTADRHGAGESETIVGKALTGRRANVVLATKLTARVMVWSPLSKGLLTGSCRMGQPLPDSLRSRMMPRRRSNENALEAVEPLAVEAGMSPTHMAMAFVMAHPGVSAAILRPRTMGQFDDLLAAAELKLSDEVLDRIDGIAPPGADVGINEAMYQPPSMLNAGRRRRPDPERAAS